MKTLILFLVISFQLLAQNNLLLLMDNQADAGFPFTTNLEMGFDETGISVSEWTDITANAKNFLQATETNQPALIADGINGYPALRFDGSDNFMQQGEVLTILQPITIYIVFKPITWTNNDVVFGYNNLLLLQGGANAHYMYAGSYEPLTALTVDTYYLLTCVFSGASSLMQVNGGEAITGNPGTAGLEIAPINLGSGTATGYANVEIAAFYLYSEAHDASERTAINTYLTTKYGL